MKEAAILTEKLLRKDLPEIKPGMRVRVWQRLKEGDKWRSSPLEGIVISQKHGKGISATFTVRRITAGDIGVEITWPLHSPLIEKIEVLQISKVRRAKLYYLRERSRRETRAKLKTKTVSPEAVKVPEEVEVLSEPPK
jgi:large subunit ribosomal protein L19